MNSQALLEQIIAAGKARGLPQKALAEKAGVRAETLSRRKRSGSMTLGHVEQLALAAGVQLSLTSTIKKSDESLASSMQVTLASPTTASFRDKYLAALAWSNPEIDTATLRRLALAKPQFQMLLDAAVEFGIDTLERDWQAMQAIDADTDPNKGQLRKIAPTTERLLKHIRYGYEQAKA